MTTRILFSGVLLAVAVSTACGTTSKESEAQTSQRPAATETTKTDTNLVQVSDEMLRDLRVTTANVEEHRGAESASMLGELSVNENAYAEVGPPLQARVISLPVRLGQRVAAGDPLVTLQSGDLARSRSDIATAESRATLARQALERKRALNAERIVPVREVQEAENEAAAAEQQVQAARSSLLAFGVTAGTTDADPSHLVVRAPIGGTVVERSAVLGQIAEPATPLFKIANLSTVWLTVHAFERDAVRLRVGETARIAFAAMPGKALTGAVSFIGQGVDRESRTVPVRIELQNLDGALRPGMSATAFLPVGDEGATILTVPTAALQRVRDRWCVFVPKDEKTFEIRPVGRGRDLVGEVEVLTGLRSGETVVVDGAFLLKAEAEKSAGEHEEH
jgi:cobalt-zinc-cadmium efflux system membrane fusion protein